MERIIYCRKHNLIDKLNARADKFVRLEKSDLGYAIITEDPNPIKEAKRIISSAAKTLNNDGKYNPERIDEHIVKDIINKGEFLGHSDKKVAISQFIANYNYEVDKCNKL